MALNSGSLAAEIKTKVESKNPDFQPQVGDLMDWLFEAVAEAVVEHIQANAAVNVTSITGVTASACGAGGAAGTLTSGSGSGTVG